MQVLTSFQYAKLELNSYPYKVCAALLLLSHC